MIPGPTGRLRQDIKAQLGEVESVTCLGTTDIPERYDEKGKKYRATADDSAYATFRLKGGVIARIAIGTRHGFDRASIREPAATLFDDVHHAVPRDLHFATRCRHLAGAALGYAVDDVVAMGKRLISDE